MSYKNCILAEEIEAALLKSTKVLRANGVQGTSDGSMIAYLEPNIAAVLSPSRFRAPATQEELEIVLMLRSSGTQCPATVYRFVDERR